MKRRTRSMVLTGALISAITLLHALIDTTYAADVDPKFMLRGAVDFIDREHGIIAVLGHRIAARPFQQIDLGDVVVVTWPEALGGQALVSRVGEINTPGVTRVTGVRRIIAVDAALARVKINEVWIDYTAALSLNSGLSFSVGQCVQFSGMQPVALGVVLADSAEPLQCESGAQTTPDATASKPKSTFLNRSPIVGTNAIIGTNAIVGTNGIIGGGKFEKN